jgi:glutathione-regulated potassium-efflux system ancillary protein KefC/glutathione-regulated potassium-efflux system protein KefB
MSANLGVLLESPLAVLGLTLAYLGLKMLAGFLAALLAKHDRSTSWRVGVALAGGGEFAFVLVALAAGQSLLPRATADLIVIVVTLSMLLAPLAIAAADAIARRFSPPPPPPAYDVIESEEPRVLIAGFGRFGQIVARVLRARHIRFTALEVSQAQVDFVRRFGNKLYYGDAARLDLLRAAGAGQARVLVIAVDDVEASLRIADTARRHFPNLRVLARARNRQHAFRLMEVGVTEIWRETFASSLEMAESTLVALGTSPATAASQVRRFRAQDEATLRAQAAVKDDETKVIATAQAAAQQLEQLFDADERIS